MIETLRQTIDVPLWAALLITPALLGVGFLRGFMTGLSKRPKTRHSVVFYQRGVPVNAIDGDVWVKPSRMFGGPSMFRRYDGRQWLEMPDAVEAMVAGEYIASGYANPS